MTSSYSQILSQPVLQEDTHSEVCKRRMDSIPNEIRCYLVAAWANDKAGIGIFFHFPHNHNALFVKATTDIAQSTTRKTIFPGGKK